MPDGAGNIVSNVIKHPLKALPTVATLAAAPYLAPEVGAALGVGETVAGGLTGAGLGGLSSALTGGNPLTGAITGGIGGAVSPNIPDITNSLGITSAPAAGAPGLGGGGLETLDIAAPVPTPAPSAFDIAAPGAVSLSTPDLTTFGFDPAQIAAPTGSEIVALSPSAVASGIPTATPAPTTAPGLPSAETLLAAPVTPTEGVTISEKPGFGERLAETVTSPKAILGALGLGAQAALTPSVPAVSPALEQAAANAAAQSAALQSSLQTGELPPGAQGAIDQATNAAKKRVIANYAARGMDTNPATNASLAQEFNSIDQKAAESVVSLAADLYKTGISEADLSSNLYKTLLESSTAANARIGNALSNFTSALAGAGAK